VAVVDKEILGAVLIDIDKKNAPADVAGVESQPA
jgi:hypothetical protein